MKLNELIALIFRHSGLFDELKSDFDLSSRSRIKNVETMIKISADFESEQTGNDLESFKYETFGNKLLIFLRTYILLKFLPFWLWKIKDRIANFIYNNPIHIICIYSKKY